MSIDAYFCISTIDAALEVRRHCLTYPDIAISDAIRQLRLGASSIASLDFDGAVKLADIVGWDAFSPHNNRLLELQDTISQLAILGKPVWTLAMPYGRNKVKRLMNDDQLQCMNYAGLFSSSPDNEAIAWWNRLAAYFRQQSDVKKQEIGFEGESLTLQFETQRLESENFYGKKPVLMSLDDSTAGFDVLSYINDGAGKLTELAIEVKSCTSVNSSIFLTRNEWQVAQLPHRRHIFHLWRLDQLCLLQLNVNDIGQHIPIDTGRGSWTEVCIPVKAIWNSEKSYRFNSSSILS